MNDALCPHCLQPIPAEQINTEQWIALCPACGRLGLAVDLVAADEASLVAAPPPAGCELLDDGVQRGLRARCGWGPLATSLLLFALPWNGILWLVLAMTLIKGFVGFVAVAIVVFAATQAIGLWLLLSALHVIFGNVSVLMAGDQGRVINRLGPLRWTRVFSVHQLRRIYLGRSTWRMNDRSSPVLCIESDRLIQLGAGLNDSRLRWACAVLRRMNPRDRVRSASSFAALSS